MSEAEVTEYINSQSEPTRSTLEQMRQQLLEIEPGLEQVIAWKAPMFKLDGKYVVGLCAHKTHISFSPQSADVMLAHAKQLENYVVSKGSFQFSQSEALPKSLTSSLVRARVQEIQA